MLVTPGSERVKRIYIRENLVSGLKLPLLFSVIKRLIDLQHDG